MRVAVSLPGEEPSAYVSLAGRSDRTRRVSQPADRVPVAVGPGDGGTVTGEQEAGREPGLGRLDPGHDAGRLVGDPVAASGCHVAAHGLREALPVVVVEVGHPRTERGPR